MRPGGGWLGVLDADTRAVLGQCASLALHLGLFAAAALSRPPLSATESATDEATVVTMESYAVYPVTPAIAEQEPEAPTTLHYEGGAERLDDGGGEQAAPGEGKAGSSANQTAAGAIARQGPEDNLDVGPAQRGLEEPRTWWRVGPFETPTGNRHGLEVSHDAIGSDPQDVLGNLQSPAPAEAAGLAGSGLAGTGRGGRGLACVGRRSSRGIGVGHVGLGGWAGALKPGAPGPSKSKRWSTSGMRGATSGPAPQPQDLDCDD